MSGNSTEKTDNDTEKTDNDTKKSSKYHEYWKVWNCNPTALGPQFHPA